MTVRGVVGGVLALVILQVLVSRGGSDNARSLLGALGTGVKRALDPAVPAIPDVRGSVLRDLAPPKRPAAAGGRQVPASQAAALGLSTQPA
jgi:hypothetical protein